MISAVTRLLSILTPEERRSFLRLVITVSALGALQVASVGSIVPFVSLLIDSAVIHQNAYLNWIYQRLGFGTDVEFILCAGFGVLAVLIVANGVAAYAAWYEAKFAMEFQRRLSTTLLHTYLSRPYTAFLNRNSAEISKNILGESELLTYGIVVSLSVMATSVSMILLMFVFLGWLAPVGTAIAAAVLATIYVVLHLFIKNPLTRIGLRRLNANTARYKIVQESFGSVKELKLLGLEPAFVNTYAPNASTFAKSMVLSRLLGALPKYLVETLVFGALMLVLLYFVASAKDLAPILPAASAFAFAGYRILPAFQAIYQSAGSIRFNSPVLDVVCNDLAEAEAPLPIEQNGARRCLPMTRELVLERMSYTYPASASPAVRDVTLQVRRKAFIALVGATGAGKTTLADIILGLLQPQEGRMLVDGVEITGENRSAWQANLGYVPQDIFLTDDSVAANIAFGVPVGEIDMAAVERAATMANIHAFIAELPAGYATLVGERGVRLSGGQRQRIGIARALYRDPEVLVFDEATSALDSATEAAVHESMVRAAQVKTIIVIAHRMATVRECDYIYVMAEGRIAAHGTYGELVKGSAEFRRIAQQGEADAAT